MIAATQLGLPCSASTNTHFLDQQTAQQAAQQQQQWHRTVAASPGVFPSTTAAAAVCLHASQVRISSRSVGTGEEEGQEKEEEEANQQGEAASQPASKQPLWDGDLVSGPTQESGRGAALIAGL